MSSNTMNSAALLGKDKQNDNSKNNNTQNKQVAGDEKQAGRKEKPDDEKSTKTLQNKESMS